MKRTNTGLLAGCVSKPKPKLMGSLKTEKLSINSGDIRRRLLNLPLELHLLSTTPRCSKPELKLMDGHADLDEPTLSLTKSMVSGYDH